mmetsp:Transcript_31687/g.41960  ORF Transcript_31687/g.41960 Transcript_31687/m.41960 type:complete len:159 (-) Transcript_31687:1820-2296(-)|eukprot:CAMPEP_0185566898 /NCGR_PEP_ID=MMETSP0434-20130131/318_1 /TAXON_ID=626734 ORGANISM="Favella taraikaensis, Strain Fe Narragansett Bay" /NCGR_SAMPLE_ID=MMETSP0434 /ASSEMBLY_ACC=CAM_ASM_000379 /LENGTH=158 /DNA_ID=CAMNT_0028180955 /DNA_START=78 /DNA_END=554 /DNA_ORIENTATION=-
MFKVRGEDSVRTYSGGCLSLIIMYITFLFAALKLEHLMTRHNPAVNVFVDKDAMDDSDIWEGADSDFAMAFTVIDYITGEPKEDPKFVEWAAEYFIADVDGSRSKLVPIRRCTDEDYAKFFEPTKSSAGLVQKHKDKRAWMCVEWNEVELYGSAMGSN